MIIAITGTPGSGKSAYAISVIYDNLGRRKIYTNIDTKLFHYKIYDIKEILTVPDNSMIVIDESQRYFSKLTPEFLEFFSYHRHRNIDIYLITQSLSSLDKRLVELLEYEVNFMKSIFRLSNSVFVARYRHNDEVFAVKKYNLSKYFEYYKSFDTAFLRKQKNVMLKYVSLFIVFVLLFLSGVFFLKYKFTNSTVVGVKDKRGAVQKNYSSKVRQVYKVYTSGKHNFDENNTKNENSSLDVPKYEKVIKNVSEVISNCVDNKLVGVMYVNDKIVKLYENGYMLKEGQCIY